MDIQNVGQPLNAGVVETGKPVNCQPKVDLTQKEDSVELSTKQAAVKKDAPTSKKIGVGIASALYPGFGQLINGQVGKGAKFFFGQIGLDALSYAGTIALYAVNPGLALAVGVAGGLAHLGVGIASIVDAVKNA